MTTDNKHKWECISPGEYDTTYRCSKCGALHTDQADDPSSLIPEFGCPVSTDLKSMTVEELREMEWRADEHADFSGYKIHAVAEEAFDELARRLEEAQQKIAEAKAEALEELQVLCSKFNIPLPKIVGNQAAGYRAKAGRKE